MHACLGHWHSDQAPAGNMVLAFATEPQLMDVISSGYVAAGVLVEATTGNSKEVGGYLR